MILASHPGWLSLPLSVWVSVQSYPHYVNPLLRTYLSLPITEAGPPASVSGVYPT